METPKNYLDLLPPEIGARVDRLIEENRFFELMKLDPEIRLYVLAQVRYPDLMGFCVASRAAKEICEDDFFWKIKTERDFGQRWDVSEEPTSGKWVDTYKKFFKDAQNSVVGAMYSRDTTELQALLELGVDPNSSEGHRNPPLHTAVQLSNMEEIIRILLDYADVDYLPRTGYTPLMLAKTHEYSKLLIHAGADPNIAGREGRTPLMKHVRKPEIVELLLNAGADPAMKDMYGNTALFFAAEGNGSLASIQLLLEAGADPNVRDEDGRTVLYYQYDLAKMWGERREDIIELLQSYGATT